MMTIIDGKILFRIDGIIGSAITTLECHISFITFQMMEKLDFAGNKQYTIHLQMSYGEQYRPILIQEK